MKNTFLRPSEKAVYDLRALYRGYGYRHYKMSRFEEYDLYAKNKSFLADKNVLTFTDTDGRLMALKPDVTLSVIRNTQESGGMHKMFYNEQVYRTGAGGGFTEIMQTGLECIGDIDLYSTAEVVALAYKSLKLINSDFILELSHMGFLSGLIDELTDDESIKARLLRAAGDKNITEIRSICENCDALCEAVMLYGAPKACSDKMRGMIQNAKMRDAWQELCDIVELLDAFGISDRVRFDFSIVNDTQYYNGVIFKGFINGISKSVLSGGRYDNLMACMGKNQGALGFAVYLDELDRLMLEKRDTDIDILLVYDSSISPAAVAKKVKECAKDGKTVRAQASDESDCRFGEVIYMGGANNGR